MKVKHVIAPMCLAVGLALSAPLGATVISNLLTFDGGNGIIGFPPVQAGGEDKLQDDSLSRLIDTGTPGISVGDSVFGVLTLSEINASGSLSRSIGVSEQIAILYAGTYAVGPGGTLTIVANPGLLSATCGAICGTASLTPTSIAVFLSTSTGVNGTGTNDPLNWDALGANSITANFNNANNLGTWSWEMTAGLSGDSFFQFSGDPLLGGLNRGAFDITSNAFGATFLPVDVLDFQAGLHTNDLTLDVGRTDPAALDEQGRGWTFRDQSTFFLNPTVAVPLPGTLALFGLGFIGMVLGRKKLQA